MREIKFRAWYHHKHNTDNGWMEYLSFGIDDLYQNKFLLTEELPTLIGLKHFVPIEGFKHEKDFAIMQYTGLKDKNGKEIYEGDIVKIHWPSGSHAISKVGWDFSSWQLEGGGMIGNFKNNELEIIGNIFENPELLTPEDSNEAK